MATYSPSLKLTLLADGEQAGTWGQTQNANLGTLLEQAITGVQSITMVDADYTLTNLNGASDEARNAVLVVGGTNNDIRKVVAPLQKKLYTIVNNTSGGYAITIGGSTGTYITVPNGATTLVYCDATNFYTGISYIQGTSSGIETSNFKVVQSGSNLVFQYNGITVVSVSSAGTITTSGSVTAAGSVTAGT